MKGRPLRFLGVVVGGWTAARVVLLWPAALPAVSPLAVPLASAAPMLVPPVPLRETPLPFELVAMAPASVVVPVPVVVRKPAPRVPAPPPTPADPRQVALALAAMARFGPAHADPLPTLPPPLPPSAWPRAPGRLSGSLWGIVRGGDRIGLPGGQLGGSQAGVRVGWALDGARRLAATARVSGAIGGGGREAALGVEWRPAGVPVRVIAEQRIAVDGGRGGPTLMLAGGMPPTPVAGLSAEGYAQGGAIARGSVEGFADGAARIARPLVRGRWRLDLGLGAWGGAQRGAARLDLGPSLGVGVPVGARRLRVTLDWRARVAGDARPGSGPALSIGGDF